MSPLPPHPRANDGRFTGPEPAAPVTPPEPPVPPANGVNCLDCSGFANYYRDTVECPDDPEHVIEPVYITDTPLGRSDDADNHVARGRGYWVYQADEPDRDA